MNNLSKKITSFFMAILMIASVSTSYADIISPIGSNTTVTLPKVNLQKKATIKIENITKFDSSGKTTAAIMKIAQKYYKLAQPNIEKNLKGDFQKNVMVAPKFDGKLKNSDKAISYSNISVMSLLSNDTLYYSIAFASAAFSEDAKSNLVSGNLAEAIYRLQTYKDENKDKLISKEKLKVVDDVIAIYQYAISLNPKNPDTLVNLGNIFIDLDRQEDAKILFQEALKVSPKYYRAKEGMAAYYLARGDWKNAKKQLESDIVLTASRKKEIDKGKILSDKNLAPDVSYMDSAETAKAAIEKLSKLPVLSTADFIQEIDPVDAQQIRNKVNNLPQKDRLVLPKLTGLAGITSYKAYSDSEYGAYMWQATNEFLSKWDEEINSAMGLDDYDEDDYDYDEDEDDYDEDDYDPDIDEELNTSSDTTAPEITAKTYDDSVSDYIQKYNQVLLGKKQMAYFTYFERTTSEYRNMIRITRENYSKQMKALDDELDIQLARARSEKESSAINNKFAIKQNQIREKCFHANFDYALYQYLNVIRPMIERYWAECMPNVRMISDPDLKRIAYGLVAMTAKSAYEVMFEIIEESPYTDGGKAHLTGVTWTEYDEEYEEKMKNKAQKDYEGVNTPGKPSLEFPFEFSASTSIAGILDIKITPTSIEISATFLAAGKLNYNLVDSSLEIGLGVGAKFQSLGNLETNTMITLKVNTNTGSVEEIDWKASASADLNIAGIAIGGTYEASVMNGNKFTPIVAGSY